MVKAWMASKCFLFISKISLAFLLKEAHDQGINNPLTNFYKAIALATLCAALVGIWAFRESLPTNSDVRLTITDVSGAPLKSFFADVPPNVKISEAIRNGPPKVGSCKPKDDSTLGKIGRLLDFATPVLAQGSCCPNGNCACLGCNRYVNVYTCGFGCDGGDYRYADYDPAFQCAGVTPSDPRNCIGQCECGVTLCYNGPGCGC